MFVPHDHQNAPHSSQGNSAADVTNRKYQTTATAPIEPTAFATTTTTQTATHSIVTRLPHLMCTARTANTGPQ
eukprot:3359270-Pyramimonas_sp.AAC.1